MKSLDEHCLEDLRGGLDAMAAGDLTHRSTPVTTPIDVRDGDEIGGLGRTFDSMLGKARSAIEEYNGMRGALGDHSVLDDLTAPALAQRQLPDEEQSSASSEQVSASTQQTSASTQDIAGSAHELAGTAEELARLVGRFKPAR